MSDSSDSVESDLVRFFHRLAPPPSQYLEIRSIAPDAPARQTFHSGVEEAIETTKRHSGRRNVYVGACPRFEKRGTRQSINTVIAAWADLDYKDFDASDRARAQVLVQERLASFSLRPSILVATGNGLQAWWIFHEPVHVGHATAHRYLQNFDKIPQNEKKRLDGTGPEFVRLGGRAVGYEVAALDAWIEEQRKKTSLRSIR